MIKQVIVMRKDLKMRRGKEIAQGAHAAMSFLVKRLDTPAELSPAQREWIAGHFTKITLQIGSEAELRALIEKAQLAGLEVHAITDSGRTEFAGVPTLTCCAIGPDEAEKIDAVTGGLSLY